MMINQQEIYNGFEKQTNITRDMLLHGYWDEAILSAELLVTYLKAELGELDKESENGNV